MDYRISHGPHYRISTDVTRDGAPCLVRAVPGQSERLGPSGPPDYNDTGPFTAEEVIKYMEWAYGHGVEDARNAMRAALGTFALDMGPAPHADDDGPDGPPQGGMKR
jgi:hypothetical protein